MLDGDWKLVIAGLSAGNHRREIEKLAEKSSVSGALRFSGFCCGGNQGVAPSECALVRPPSKQENFGLAVFEAIARGCPVVVSDEVYSADCLEPLRESPFSAGETVGRISSSAPP